ncbi:hypothetical protein Ahy_B08g090508 [Arachis hypogaea]|uniref:SWIM-type domain-containing protein n=1 Tax=Arachis hypogaea TaxID=3818 RepID=A0A444Y068_ARAHY|nr:hypothetical protein Ahy_B08g090508 [Arachis hypogaea]
MVEPLGYDMSVVAEILSNHPQNISGDVIVNGEKSNKAMQLSNVTEVRSEEIELGDELPDHGCLQEHEILRVGMRFVQLWMTHDFYVTYAKKVGFATKIRMTTYDNITKAPLNQAIHCNRDGYHGSCVKAPMRKNTISAAGCKARIYVKFDKDMQDWVLFKVDLMHSHPCSARKVVHYHEYRQLTIHAKCDINLNFFYALKLDEECKFKSAVWVDARCRASYEYYGDVVSVDSTYSTNRHGLPFVSFIGINHHGNSTLLSCALLGNEKIPSYEWGEFWAAMRSTQRSESMHTFYGGFLHSKTSLVQLVHEYDNVLGVKEQRELEDDAADLGGVSVVDEQGPLVWMKMEEEKLVNDTILYVPYDVYFDRSTQEVHCECNLFESLGVLCCHCLEVFHSYKVYKVPTCYVLPRWSKKIKRKHRYVKSSHDVSRSDESHVAFRGLCAHFYNVAKEFVGDDDETALLHAAMEEIRAKLAAHRAKKRSESVSETQTSFGSQSLNVVNIDNIQGPSKVTTKGRPKSKRVSAALEKPFKNSSRRNHKNSTPVHDWLNLNFVCLFGIVLCKNVTVGLFLFLAGGLSARILRCKPW